MGKTLKYGIIGCGGIAEGKHMPAIQNLKDVEMVGFCDIIKEKAEKENKTYAAGKGTG
jgi:predicted dehydrogenase